MKKSQYRDLSLFTMLAKMTYLSDMLGVKRPTFCALAPQVSEESCLPVRVPSDSCLGWLQLGMFNKTLRWNAAVGGEGGWEGKRRYISKNRTKTVLGMNEESWQFVKTDFDPVPPMGPSLICPLCKCSGRFWSHCAAHPPPPTPAFSQHLNPEAVLSGS